MGKLLIEFFMLRFIVNFLLCGDVMNLKKSALVLVSGGVDSTACIHHYLSNGYDVKGFFVNFGQPSCAQEFESVKKITSYYDVEFSFSECNFPLDFNCGEIVGRNGFLVLTALVSNPDISGLLSLGIHSGLPYYDCTPAFVNDMNRVVEAYTNGRCKLDTPFLNWSKYQIYDYCKREDVPLSLTYSCESGGIEPCGRCLSCLDRGCLNVH